MRVGDVAAPAVPLGDKWILRRSSGNQVGHGGRRPLFMPQALVEQAKFASPGFATRARPRVRLNPRDLIVFLTVLSHDRESLAVRGGSG